MYVHHIQFAKPLWNARNEQPAEEHRKNDAPNRIAQDNSHRVADRDSNSTKETPQRQSNSQNVNPKTTSAEPPQQIAKILESIHRSLQEIERKQIDAHSQLESAAVELSVLIAERVALQAIRAEDADVKKLVHQTLARVSNPNRVTVYLSPEDLRLLDEHTKAPDAGHGGDPQNDNFTISDLNVLVDGTLSRGDCYVDSDDLGILTTFESRLTDLRQWLLEGLDVEIEN